MFDGKNHFQTLGLVFGCGSLKIAVMYIFHSQQGVCCHKGLHYYVHACIYVCIYTHVRNSAV